VEEGRPQDVLNTPAQARTREFLATYGATS
jgi:ABC-type histidine transport system ATPase subunit